MQVVGLFCEDIREEKNDAATILGTYSDNVRVPQIPGRFTKLGIYVRINLAPEERPGPLSVVMRVPDGTEIPLGDVGEELVQKAQREAIEEENPIAGIIVCAVLPSFPVPQPGRLVVYVKEGDREIPCATLNIQASPEEET
jgi:hypothetical protein